MITNLDLKASVLGQTFFCNIHFRHDLDPGNQGRLNPFRRTQQIVKNSVNPVAHGKTLLVGFDVYVAGTGFYGLGYNVIDQFNDRGFAGVIEKIGRFLNLTEDGAAVFLHILNQLFGRIPAQVILHIDG